MLSCAGPLGIRMAVASTLVLLLEVYLGLGALFALFFVTRGLERVDPDARGASLGFRILIVPGCALLWPFLLARWLRRAPGSGRMSLGGLRFAVVALLVIGHLLVRLRGQR